MEYAAGMEILMDVIIDTNKRKGGYYKNRHN
jgi:hypothetical protein